MRISAVSSIVAKSEGKMDISVFNDPDAGIMDTDEEMHIDDAVEAEMQEAIKATHDK